MIAEATFRAIIEDRFYVFYGDFVRTYLDSLLMLILETGEPPVITWGPDLRPA